VTDDELTPDPDLDARLRSVLSGAAPDVSSAGVIGAVERRAARRRRRVREAVVAGTVVLLGGGAAVGYGLSTGPQRTVAGPAGRSVPSTATSTTGPADATATQSQGVATGRGGPGAVPPTPLACPADRSTPTARDGHYCGPAPHAGNGSGPDGICTGTETVPPCGPGVVPGRYYAYTIPGTCSGLITFDGRRWVSELPPPRAVPDFTVWMGLGPSGTPRWIGPDGSVGFRPYVGQVLAQCRR